MNWLLASLPYSLGTTSKMESGCSLVCTKARKRKKVFEEEQEPGCSTDDGLTSSQDGMKGKQIYSIIREPWKQAEVCKHQR